MKKLLTLVELEDLVQSGIATVQALEESMNDDTQPLSPHKSVNDQLALLGYELTTALKTQTLLLAHVAALEERLNLLERDRHTHPEFHGN